MWSALQEYWKWMLNKQFNIHFMLFTRATSQSPCLHETLALLSASGACLATTETECRGRDNLRNSRSVFLIVGRAYSFGLNASSSNTKVILEFFAQFNNLKMRDIVSKNENKWYLLIKITNNRLWIKLHIFEKLNNI